MFKFIGICTYTDMCIYILYKHTCMHLKIYVCMHSNGNFQTGRMLLSSQDFPMRPHDEFIGCLRQ